MSKKFDTYPQIRISPKLAKRIDALRKISGPRVSRAAYVEFALNDAVGAAERQTESTFKK